MKTPQLQEFRNFPGDWISWLIPDLARFPDSTQQELMVTEVCEECGEGRKSQDQHTCSPHVGKSTRMFCQCWPAATFLAGILGGFIKPQRQKEQIMLRETGALTSELSPSACWLYAVDLTCEEQQRRFLVTVKLCHLSWASHREQGSQASTLIPGAKLFDAELQRSLVPQKMLYNNLPHA